MAKNPGPARPPREPRLGLRILLVILGAVLVSTLGTVAFLQVQSQKASGGGEADTVDAAVGAQASYEEDRGKRLRLAAKLLAAEPLITDLLLDGTGRAEITSVLNGFLNAREVESVVVRGPSGELVAAAGTTDALAQALAVAPVAQRTLSLPESSGFLSRDRQLYRLAAARVDSDFERIGSVVVAESSSQTLARLIKKSSQAEVALITKEGPALVTTTLDRVASGDLLPALSTQGALSAAFSGRRSGAFAVVLGGTSYWAEAAPIAANDEPPVGARVTLVRRPDNTGPWRQAQGVALAAGLAGALLGGLVGPWIARRAALPARQAAAMAEALRAGDWNAARTLPAPPAMTDLARDLAEAESLRTAAADLHRRRGGAAATTAEKNPGAVLLVELPRYARLPPDQDPRDLAGRYERDLLRIRRVVAGHQGTVAGALGHRALASFVGADAGRLALTAAAELLPVLTKTENAFEEPLPPALALATGTLLRSSQGANDELLGLPVQQADALLREGGPGELVLSRNAYRELEEQFTRAEVPLVAQRGLLSSQSIYVAREQHLAMLAGRAGSAGDAVAALVPGMVLGDRFELTANLGPTPSGVTFRARDRHSGLFVTLRAIRRSLLADPAALEALDSAVRAPVRVGHPNLARVIDLGLAEGVAYLVSEEVPGGAPLSDLGSERLAPASAVAVFRRVAAGLAALHQGGVAHGALGADTVWLTPTGDVRVGGVGLAGLLPPPGLDPDADACLGAPRALAPERLAGGPPSPAADVWAAGVLLAEVLTGRPLIAATDRAAERDLAVEGHYDFSGVAGLPPAFGSLVARCLERDPARRLADGSALVSALTTL